MMKHLNSTGLLLALCLSAASTAYAVPPPLVMQVDADNPAFQDTGNGVFGFTNNLYRSGTLLGNMWGVRPWLSKYGMTFSLEETSEILGNVSGGVKKGFDYDGLTQMDLQLDTQRAFGHYGGTFNVSALQIHGTNLSAQNLDSLQTASGIEADRAFRLWELWYDQKFLDQDALDIKIGQQSLDQEFIGSVNSNYFINTMMGWPMVPSADLPAGGPAYPLSDLGVRAKVKATDSITVLAGVFNGSPVRNFRNPDSQIDNQSGTTFPLNGGMLAIAEIQFAYPGIGAMVDANGSKPLSHTYKLGMWYDSERFANYGTTNAPGESRGDYSIYAVADQMLWHSENVEDRTLNFFTRVMGTPESDRNTIDFSVNGGFTLHEPFFGRDDDTFGIGMGVAHVSHNIAAQEREANEDGDGPVGVQNSETFAEITYMIQVTPWWQIQPDFQYVWQPGAGAIDPDTGLKIGNEAVIGVRTNILF